MALNIRLNPSFIRKTIWKAAKLPIMYMIIGISLIGLSYIDDLVVLTKWKNLFDFTNKLGNIFFVFALLTFVYQSIALTLYYFEKKSLDKHKVTSFILLNLRKSLKIIFILITLNITVVLLNLTTFYLNLVNNIITTLIIAFIGWISIQLLYTIETVIYEYMQTLADEDHSRIKALYTKTHIIRNIGTVIIIVITCAAILMSFPNVRNIGISLLASAGVFTAIIGLACQKALFSLCSGIQIALAQPIKIGDFVVIENESGMIEEITFTYVIVKLNDRRRLVVPINYFTDKAFENWSREYNILSNTLKFYISYAISITALRDELSHILEKSTYWDHQYKKLYVTNLREKDVEIQIQISAKNGNDLLELSSEIREKMLTYIQHTMQQSHE